MRAPPGLMRAPPGNMAPPGMRSNPRRGPSPVEDNENIRIDHTRRISQFNRSQIQNAAQNLINKFVTPIQPLGLTKIQKAKAKELAKSLIGIFDTHVRNFLCLYEKWFLEKIITITENELTNYKKNIIKIFEIIVDHPAFTVYDNFLKVYTYKFIGQDLTAKIQGFKEIDTSEIDLSKVCLEADKFNQLF